MSEDQGSEQCPTDLLPPPPYLCMCCRQGLRPGLVGPWTHSYRGATKTPPTSGRLFHPRGTACRLPTRPTTEEKKQAESALFCASLLLEIDRLDLSRCANPQFGNEREFAEQARAPEWEKKFGTRREGGRPPFDQIKAFPMSCAVIVPLGRSTMW